MDIYHRKNFGTFHGRVETSSVGFPSPNPFETLFLPSNWIMSFKDQGKWNKKHFETTKCIYTLQGTKISHLGKRKILFKMPFLGGYVSSLEGIPFPFILFNVGQTPVSCATGNISWPGAGFPMTIFNHWIPATKEVSKMTFLFKGVRSLGFPAHLTGCLTKNMGFQQRSATRRLQILSEFVTYCPGGKQSKSTLTQ